MEESEKKLKYIIENSTNLFYSHSVDHMITFVSPQVREILGYEPDEAMRHWRDFITDNPINEKALDHTEKALKTGNRQPTYRMEMKRKDGKNIMVEVREAPVVENGKVVSIVGSLNDITENIKAENDLKQKQYHLENAQSLGKIGSWDLDTIKNVLLWTDENYRVFGVPIGTPMSYEAFLSRVHPEDRNYVDTKWKAAMREKRLMMSFTA